MPGCNLNFGGGLVVVRLLKTYRAKFSGFALAVVLAVVLACCASGCGGKQGEAVSPVDEVRRDCDEMPGGLADDARAEWLIDRARYAEALPFLEKVVEERRAAGGGRRLGEALVTLGIARDALGEPEQALAPLAEAWEIFQDVEVPFALQGACADALGLACHGAEIFGEAEQAFLAAIALRKLASPGEDEPWVSASRVHLGRLYLTMARYQEAGDLLETALASARDEPSRATRLRHLGTYFHTIGGYARAVGLFEEAMVASLKIWGDGSEQVAVLSGDLGLSQLRAGDTGAAEKNLLRSREAILELADAPPDLLAASAQNLAAFYLFEGDLEKAEALLAGTGDAVALNNLGSAYHLAGNLRAAAVSFAKARALATESLREHHPLRVQILQNEACLLSDKGDPDAALRGATEAGAAALALLDHLLTFGSEGQKLDFRRTSDPLSLLCSFGADPEAIAEMVLRTKGVVLDSVLRAGDDGARKDVRRGLIPDGKTFVDYVVYQKYLGRAEWERRYGAVVLGAGETRWAELGTAEELRGLMADLRAHMDAEALGGKSDAVFSLEAVLAGLYDFCIAPLGELDGGGLIISPGGELGVVPFAALRHGGRYFCEIARDVTFVASGRAADDPQPVGAQGESWAQCAVDRYSGPELPWPGRGAGIGADLWEKLSGLGDLPGVAREREVLGRVAEFHALPTDEYGLRQSLEKPLRVLHFSCHGFFLDGGSRPMFRSGLVLGGARRSMLRMAAGEPVDPGADNVLFAGEIAELDLRGTQLVTLAACDTGLGVSVAGEGVLGLQRGFQLAGARNLLLTLWAVGDQSLPEFLGACYARIAKGEPAASAVWKTQAEFLHKGGTPRRGVWTAGGFAVLAGSPG